MLPEGSISPSAKTLGGVIWRNWSLLQFPGVLRAAGQHPSVTACVRTEVSELQLQLFNLDISLVYQLT